MKKECISMLLAGGQGSRLYALTSKAAKPIMPYGGKYRIIDFPLSNCANSGIDVVGVMTQYEPFQLNSYIGNGQPWDLDLQQGGVFILPPYQSSGEKGGWFSGTANAIYQNRNFVSQWDPEYVLILGGDQIYKMDYSKMLEEHKKNNADCTIAVIPVTLEEAKRFGIMSVGEDGYVCKFTEKPQNPDSNLASMGIYIFTWKKLLAYLTADDTDAESSKDFGKNIIPTMLKNGEKLWPFRFEGYWRDVGTIDSLWESNMDVLDPDIIDLFNADWPIRSRSPRKPPHYIGNSAKINRSIITEGCEIYGAVDNSVLSNSVTVAKGAKVTHSVLMPGCKIGPGAQVSYAIIGENAVVGKNCTVGAVPEDDASRKITTLGPGSAVEEDTVLEAGAMIYAEKEENQ